jgi:hypothetical protein
VRGEEWFGRGGCGGEERGQESEQFVRRRCDAVLPGYERSAKLRGWLIEPSAKR